MRCAAWRRRAGGRGRPLMPAITETEPQVVDAGRDVLRAVHGDARQHRREHRPAGHREPVPRVDLQPLLDGQRLHPGVRRAAGHRRPPGRRVRAQAHVPGRHRRLHARLDRRRAVAVDRPADRVPRRPGRRRGIPDAGLAVDHHQHLPGPRARPRARPVGGHLRHGAGHGPGGRRPAGREGRLGVDLLPQRPGRPDRDPGHAVRGARSRATSPPAGGSTSPAS